MQDFTCEPMSVVSVCVNIMLYSIEKVTCEHNLVSDIYVLMQPNKEKCLVVYNNWLLYII